MKHKAQHFIPRSYLKAWCDKDIPEKYTPYVWIISKDGKRINNKSPEKIFYENNIYTITGEDGKRNLSIEYSLSSLESEFNKLREKKLISNNKLTKKEELYLMMFTSAMFGRTKIRGQHEKQNWQKVLDLGNRMKETLENASPDERKKMTSALSSPHGSKKGFSLKEVEHIVNNPLTSTLPTVISTMSPLLMSIPRLILTTDDEIGFITSDNPCVWFDPASQQDLPPYGAGGLVSPTLEITLPLSPKHLLFISPGLKVSNAYIEIRDDYMIDNFNLRTRIFSDESIIVNKRIVKGEWF